MSIVIISFTCCFLQIYDDFYGPFFNDISGGILNDYLQFHLIYVIIYDLINYKGFTNHFCQLYQKVSVLFQ